MTRALSSDLVMRAVAASSLEWKLTDPLAFGLTTASDVQRAVCRVADGQPLGGLAKVPAVQSAIGDVSALDGERPDEVAIISGIRTAKSLTAACGAFHMAVTCDVSSLRPGEIPRVSVVSLKKDLADVIMNHLVGSLKASPLLSKFLIGQPSGEGLVLRHPTGIPVEVCVVAGSRAGASLVARWSAGCIFDEFPRMVGGDDAVVNWDDSRAAVVHRLLPGCQLWHIGSPWGPFGPAYEMVTSEHGRPSKRRVVVRAPAYDMNPVLWTPEKCAERKAADADAYKTDVEAEFATPEEAMFSLESVRKCVRSGPLRIARKDRCTYYAAMDPATRGNGWTLAIATRENGKAVVVRAEEWQGSRDAPLDPADVLEEIADIVGQYGITTIHSDQVMGDALVRLARDRGLMLAQWTFNSTEKARRYLAIRTQLDQGLVDLPPVPHLRTDLLHIRRRVTPGGMTVDLPMTSDGRHCDFGPTLMLVLTKALPEPPPETRPGSDPETERMRELIKSRLSRKENW